MQQKSAELSVVPRSQHFFSLNHHIHNLQHVNNNLKEPSSYNNEKKNSRPLDIKSADLLGPLLFGILETKLI